jgi:RNA polymerase sigma-70 factor, ECF subfamily
MKQTALPPEQRRAMVERAIPHALADAIDSSRPQIFRFLLLSVREAETAERLTRHCLCLAYLEWLNLHQYTTTTAWLLGIAIRIKRRYFLKRRFVFWRQPPQDTTSVVNLKDLTPINRSSLESRVFAQEQVRRAWKAVNAMNDNERTIFLLRFVEEFNWNDITEATKLEERTVKECLSLALRRVRAELRGTPATTVSGACNL